MKTKGKGVLGGGNDDVKRRSEGVKERRESKNWRGARREADRRTGILGEPQ